MAALKSKGPGCPTNFSPGERGSHWTSWVRPTLVTCHRLPGPPLPAPHLVTCQVWAGSLPLKLWMILCGSNASYLIRRLLCKPLGSLQFASGAKRRANQWPLGWLYMRRQANSALSCAVRSIAATTPVLPAGLSPPACLAERYTSVLENMSSVTLEGLIMSVRRQSQVRCMCTALHSSRGSSRRSRSSTCDMYSPLLESKLLVTPREGDCGPLRVSLHNVFRPGRPGGPTCLSLPVDPSTVLYCTVLYCTVLYCTVLYCTVLYCTVLYCTVLSLARCGPTELSVNLHCTLKVASQVSEAVCVGLAHTVCTVCNCDAGACWERHGVHMCAAHAVWLATYKKCCLSTACRGFHVAPARTVA
jgi:hypothetical protein